MKLGFPDYFAVSLFGAFLLFEIYRSWSRRKSNSGYFNAGSNLHWIYIGMSLLTADITIEYIISSSSEGYLNGLAIGSYEWTASIALIVVALFIIPLLLRTGILTLPEFLEYRYGRNLRIIVAVIVVISNITGLLVPILFSNGMAIAALTGISPVVVIWSTGIIASTIIFAGGLSSKVRIDLIIGALFLTGAVIVTAFAFIEVKGFENFILHSHDRMHSVLPASDSNLPWTTVFFGGLWVAHFFYWAFNQHITQTVLVSQTLSQAQKGMLFVATIKLLLPFVLIVPGIISLELLGTGIENSDTVLPRLIEKVIPQGFRGFIMVAYFGTVIAALNAVVNASATIFTHDIYATAFTKENAEERKLIAVSRIAIIALLLIGCALAPYMDTKRNIFEYSELFASVISPTFLAIYLFGVFSGKTPASAAIVAIVAGIPSHFILMYYAGDSISSLDLAGINFIFLCLIMGMIRYFFPLKEPVVLPERRPVKFERNIVVLIWSIFIITGVAAIYLMFL